jgi:hypothetical protein
MPAHALDLYSGEVAVEDQSAAQRQQSFPAALIQVLQKHSGQRSLPIHPALDAALVSARRLVVSFYYKEHERMAADGTATKEWHLVANFLPDKVDELVRQLELPRWLAERKPITIWIVVDDGQGRRLMPLEYDYAWAALTDVAGIRGLPISWPDLDEEQTQELDLQLLWGGFAEDLISEEDNESAVIVAARREGPIWNVRWNFATAESTASWRIRDRELSFALVDGLHRLTELVATRNSIAPSGQGNWQIELHISGFRGGDDYARCLAYLEGLTVVDRVDIIEVGRGDIRFSLSLNALPQYLQNEIAVDDTLEGGPAENVYELNHPQDPGQSIRGAQQR